MVRASNRFGIGRMVTTTGPWKTPAGSQAMLET